MKGTLEEEEKEYEQSDHRYCTSILQHMSHLSSLFPFSLPLDDKTSNGTERCRVVGSSGVTWRMAKQNETTLMEMNGHNTNKCAAAVPKYMS